MLKQRIITAALLIPIVVGLIFYASNIAFACLTGIVVLIAAMEWMALMKLETIEGRLAYLFLLLTGMSALSYLLFPPQYVLAMVTLSMAMLWWIIAFVLILIYPRGAAVWARSKILTGLIGVIVLLLCWLAVNILRSTPNGAAVLLYVFLLIWGADTSAYFVGKKWGAHKLAEKVSPGKTWEGFAGAIIFTLIFSAGAAMLTQPPLVILIYAIGLSVWTVLFSVVGDLFESMMKREAGFKDSGNLLPGHGGLLDRIDSLTAAAPVYAFTSMFLSLYFLQ